jgi:hypothetical protein
LYKDIDMSEAITFTYNKIQEICLKEDTEKRRITKSIQALLEAWVFHYIRYLKRRLHSYNSPIDISNILYDTKNGPSNYFWNKEFYLTFQKAFNSLSLEEQQIIHLKLENKTLEEISRVIGRTRHITNKLFQQAGQKIDLFFQQAGLDIYRK